MSFQKIHYYHFNFFLLVLNVFCFFTYIGVILFMRKKVEFYVKINQLYMNFHCLGLPNSITLK